MAENEKQVVEGDTEDIDPLDAFMAEIAPTVRSDMNATAAPDTDHGLHIDGQARVKVEDASDVKQTAYPQVNLLNAWTGFAEKVASIAWFNLAGTLDLEHF